SYENQNHHPTGSSSLLWNERHGVAESFKLPDRTLCQPRAISLLEIICSQIVVRLLGREHVIDDRPEGCGKPPRPPSSSPDDAPSCGTGRKDSYLSYAR